MSNLLTRTKEALGPDFTNKIQEYRYCIIGCGGTGALFAEMLVRTGANKIILIDGDKVEESNLNRVVGFVKDDIGKNKTDALMSKLRAINSEVEITAVSCCLREPDPSDHEGQKARDAFYNSDLVIIAVDDNKSRIICENLCYEDSNKRCISMGVHVNGEGEACYECAWKPKTPIEKEEEAGYGNGSYASIVIEATSVAFSMLLHNLKNPNSSDFTYYFQSYENFIPKKRV